MRTNPSERVVPLDVEWAESGFDKVVIEIAKNTAYIKRIMSEEKELDYANRIRAEVKEASC